MDEMRKKWVEFQQLRRDFKRANMPVFENVLLIKNNQEIQVHLEIDEEEMKICPVDPGEHEDFLLRQENINGCNTEGSKIILNFRRRPPYILHFPTAEEHQRALILIRQIFNDDGDDSMPDTPPLSSSDEGN